MVRKLAAVFLLSFLVIAFVSVSLGADKMQKPTDQRATIPARFAPVYSFPSDPSQAYTDPAGAPQKAVLRGGSRANPEDVGQTSYDYQHNCTMGRQIEHRVGYVGNPTGTYIHMDWMSQLNAVYGLNRGIGYQAFNLQNCTYSFAVGTGTRIEGEYAGYVGMDAHNLDMDNSWAVPVAHEQKNQTVYYAKAFWDYYVGGPVFGVFVPDYPSDNYGWYLNNGVGPGNETIWPKHDWDIDGADYVLHMVTAESGGPLGSAQSLSYYRRVGPYGTDEGVWSDQHVIDTVMNINVTVASSPISDKLAIVWNAPVDYVRDQGTLIEYGNQYENDVWFAIATDNGAQWASQTTKLGYPSIGHTVDLGIGVGYNPAVGGNLTTYDSLSIFKAYCDMSALWSIKDDPNDYLQIVWGCRRWGTEDPAAITLYRRQGAVFHWNQKYDEVKSVVKALWDTGGDCVAHAWGTDAAKMTISECDGKLYICYTQFGTSANPCGTYDSQAGTQGRVMAGQLYMTVYDETYRGWDRPQTVTGPPHAPGECTRPTGYNTANGTCNSEYWSSMARYGRTDNCKLGSSGPAVDILYINDLTPGGAIQTESGVWNLNPVRWMVYACRAAVPEPGFLVDPTEIGVCYDQPVVALGTTDDVTITLTMENDGIIANSPVSLVANYVGGGSGNTAVTLTPNSGINIPAGEQVPVDVHIVTTGEDNWVVVNYNIVITQQAGENPPNTVTVPMCILVDDGYQALQGAIIATTCKRLRVYNNGELSNNATNASLDFMADPDDCATVYLYDGSPVICRDDNGTKVCFHSAFDNYYGTPSTMRAVSPLFVDSTSHAGYTYATAEFLTGDSAIGLIVEYYAPKAEADCGYVIQKLKFWNKTEVTLNGVAAGEVLDWDVESHEHGSENYPGRDATRNLVYQGCRNPLVATDTLHHDPCDTLQQCNRYAGIAAAVGVGTGQDTLGFKNYLVLENDVFVYTSGDYDLPNNPLDPDSLYVLMNGKTGYWWKNYPNNPADTGEDLNTVVTFGVYDMDPNDTLCVVKILTTSRSDASAAGLKNNVDLANDFIAAHSEIKCFVIPSGCCDTAGDANNDLAVNIGDAVYLINYIFKGGPPPPCLDEGDANADCAINIGDGVYLINYIFKGGPSPLCGCVPPPK